MEAPFQFLFQCFSLFEDMFYKSFNEFFMNSDVRGLKPNNLKYLAGDKLKRIFALLNDETKRKLLMDGPGEDNALIEAAIECGLTPWAQQDEKNERTLLHVMLTHPHYCYDGLYICINYFMKNYESVEELPEKLNDIKGVLAIMLEDKAAVNKYLLSTNTLNTPIASVDNARPLHFAAWCNPEMVQWLLDNGAELNGAVDDHGRTPFHFVAEFGSGCLAPHAGSC